MTTLRSFVKRVSSRIATALKSLLTFRNLLPPVLSGAMFFSAQVPAGPTDGTVIIGDVDIVQSTPKHLDIIQGSDKVIIDWRLFSIDLDESVRFKQPSSTSIALNRVSGGTPSYILGRLTADGRIMLINPNGILFGKSAVVDVNSLVATTIDIEDEDFMEGHFHFDVEGETGGTVVNRGRITAAEGGLVALVAPGVKNSGVIVARLGRVALASGNSFTLDFYGDKLIQIGLDDEVAEQLIAADGTELTALVDNSGEILADGGTVMLMAASAARDVVDYAINMDGIIEARSAKEVNGRIVLEGTGEGIVRVAGTLDTSGRGSGEKGGTIKVLGSKVGVVGEAKVDATGDAGGGEVLIGGNFQGKGPERNAEYTVIGGKAAIQADALTAGDGGRVIVWSDRVTRFFGNISARGGGVSGDGGFAEISGKKHLLFIPDAIDLSASNGLKGKLLLDPRDITISDSDGTHDSKISETDPDINFSDDSTTDYKIKPSAFEAIDADVTLQASRDITVSSAIDRSGSADSTLTLQAGRNLNINADITGTNGAHSFIFEADSPQSGSANDGTGTVTIGSNVTITSNNGDITLIGAAFDIDSTASVNAGTGNIYVAPSQATAMTISSAANNLSNAEIGRLSSTGTIQIGAATTGPTGTNTAGSLISATDITISQALTVSSAADLVFRASQDITVSSGITKSASTASTLTLQAGRHVTVSANITGSNAAHSLIFEADSPQSGSANDGTGKLTIGNHTITSNNGDITLIGAAFDIGSTSSVNAGTGNIYVAPSQATAMTISSTGDNLSNAEIGRLSSTGTIQIGAATTGPTATLANGSSISATDITISQALTVSSAADLVFRASQDITVSSAITRSASTATTLALQAGRHVTVSANITGSNAAHSFIFEADSPRSGSANDGTGKLTIGNHTITSNNGDITLIGAAFDIGSTSSVNAGTGNIYVAPSRAVAMTISSAADNLSNAEIGRLSSTGTIQIGAATTGPTATLANGSSISATDITISQALTVSGAADLVFRASQDITVSSAITRSASTATTLALQAGRHVTVSANITGSNAAHSFIFEADSPRSGSANDGTGKLTIGNHTITSNNGDITLIGAAFDIGSTSSVNAGSGDIHVAPSRAVAMTISSAADNLSNAEIGRLTSTGTIHIGTATTGPTITLAAGSSISATSITISQALTIGGSAALSFDSSGTTTLSANVSTDDGDITFEDAVTLGADITVDSDADNDATDGDITFTSTIDGGQTLTLDADGGAVDLQGTVGGTTKLTSLTVDGGQVDLDSVKTTGAIDIEGTNIDLNGTAYETDGGNITFTGAVDLAANVSVDSDKDGTGTDGSITFTSTIDGGQTLTLDADGGAVDLQGNVGGTTKLTSLTVDGGQVDLDSVKATGTIDVEGTNIDLNGTAYETDGGNITFTGAVDLTANVSVDSDKDGTGTDGDITFTSTINGGQTLTLDADGGAVDLQGAVGGTTKLTSLTVDGGQVDLDSVKTTGAIDIEGTNIDLNGTAYETDGGNITFTGAVDLTANVSVDSDKDGTGTDGEITFTSTINGGQTLTLDADGGAVDLQGAVGGTTKLTSLTVDGGQIDLKSVKATGAVDIEGTNIDLNGTAYESDDGDITFTGAVDLTVNVSVDSDKDNDSNDGDITFTSTVNGSKTLTLDASGGAVDLQGAVGGTTKLTSLTVDGGQVDLDSVKTTGAIDIEGTNIDLNGTAYETDGGNITFTGAVDLAANVSVDSDKDGTGTDGSITFTSTIDGGQTLTLDADGGTVDLQGNVGGTTKLTSLTVDGGQVDLKSVKTTGAIDIEGTNIDLNGTAYESDDGNIKFTGAVDLTVNVSVDSDKDNDSNDGDITFTSTVNGSKTLTLDASGGAVDLQGAVGGTTKLTSLTVDGGQVDLDSVKTTGAIDIEGTNIDLNGTAYESDDGDITFTGAVDLTVNVSVDSDKDNDSNDGDITFTSTVNGSKTLTLDASGGAVDLQGAVGGTTKLTSLTVDGGQVDLKSVKTTGAIDIEGTNIDLNGTAYETDGGNITFTGAVDLAANVSVDSDKDGTGTDGSITFTSTIDGGQTLTLDADGGTVDLQGNVGGTTKLTSLTVDGGQVDLDSVKTTGAIDIEGTNIDLNGTAYETDGGNITFTGAVDLAANVSVDSDKDGTGTDGSITFTSTIDGGQTLTLDADGGTVDLQGNVGGTTKLTSLTVDGGQVDLKSVKTTGAIDIEGTNIDLNGTAYESDDGNIKFTGAVDLTVNVSVDSDKDNDSNDGDITFTSTVNGSKTLTLDAGGGAVDLQGNVGGTTKLTSLTVDGGQIDLKSVKATGAVDIEGTNIDLNGTAYESDDGDITFTGAVDLTANVSVDSDKDNDSNDGDITFTSTINGGQTLSLDADGGSVTVSGAVGGTTKLTSLTVDGGSVSLKNVATTGAISVTGTGITLDGDYDSNDGDIEFTGAVTLSGAVSVDSDADSDATDGDITFTSTVNGGQTLTLDADGGDVDLQGNVGGTTKLTSLTVDGGQIDLKSVKATGAVDIEGTNIDLNGTAYESDDGDITFTGAVDLTANVSVDSDKDNDSNDGDITFTSTINGGQTLSLDADGGSVTVSGAVGGTTKLTSLTVDGGSVSLKNVATTGAISVTGTGITLDGDYDSNDGDIEFTGAVTLSGAVSVDSDADSDATDGDITFTSTVNGGQTLTLDADGGDVDLQGNVGGTTKLTSLTVDGGQIDLKSVKATGAVDIEGTNIDLNGTAYESDDGDITFTGAVDLTVNVSVDSDKDNDSNDGDITFTSTVNGSKTLTLDASGGAVDLQGAVGGTTKLTSLTVDGGQVDLDSVKTTGAIDIEGTNIDLNGTAYETDGGNITFTGAVDLAANVSVDSDKDGTGTDGSITFTSTIDGGQTLTLDADGGTVDLQGNVGGTTKLTSLTVDGGQVDLKSVKTTGAIDIEGTNIDLNGTAYETDGGNITFTGAVDLAANVSVDSDKDGTGTDGSITFTSTIDGGQTLTLDADGGTVDLQGNVGGTTKLTSLTVDGGQVDLKSVKTTGAIDIEGTNIDLNGTAYESDDGNIKFTGAVDLTVNVSVDSDKDNDSNDGDITFTSTVNGSKTLTLDAGGGAVDLQGNVGGTTKLTSLTVDGGQIDLKSVKATGAVDIEGTNIDLNGTAYESDDGDITFTGAVDLTANVSVDSDKDNDSNDGDITFTSTINGGQTLSLDADGGSVTVSGAVGGTTKLTSLTVDGGSVSLKNVATTGAISVTGTGITLDGDYDSNDGDIEFTGAVTLSGAVSVDSDADSDATDGDITFTSTVNGGQTLTLDADGGDVDLQGNVGGTTKLTSLTVDGGQIDLKSVKATGAVDIEGTNIDLNGTAYESDDGDITFTGAVDLTANVSVDSDKDNDSNDGDITFTSTINGGQTLSLDADGGSVTVSGAVGGTTKLTSLTVDGGSVSLKNVATTGAISVTGTGITLDGDYDSNDGDIEFTGAVTLSGAVSVDSDADSDATDGDITFTSTVNGGQTLTLDADGGDVDLQGNVGGTTKLTSLTVDGGQIDLKSVKATGAVDIEGTNIDLNGTAYESDDGDITFTGAVDLTVNVSVDSDKDNDSNDGDITFTSTVNGSKTLTLDASGGAVDLQGAVGGTTKLTSLTVDGGQVDLDSVKTTGAIDIEGTNIDLNGTAYETDGGNITFTGAVDLAANVSVDSDKDGTGTDGSITFTSTIDGGQTLTLDADGGAVDLQGAVGGTTKLTSLTVDGGQVDLKSVKTTGAIDIEGTNIDLNGTAYETDGGNITFTGAVDLAANVSVDSDKDGTGTDGSITFTSTIDGGQTLTLDADGGTVDLQGNVGGTTKLTSLTVDGGQVDLKSVKTTGAIDIEGTNIDLNGTAYESDDGNIKFTGAVDLTVNVSVDSDKDNDSNDGDITFTSTVNGSKTLTLDAGGGAVDLQGNVGGTTKLTSLTVDGGQIDLKSVKATGAVDIEGTNIDLNGTAYESDDGDITFTGAVDLTANVSVDSDKDNDSNDGDITFTSTINGGQTLSLDADGGSVTVSGAVGGTTKLTSLTVNGGQVDLKSVKTTGAIDIEGTNIDLNGTAYESDDGDITFTGPVDLTVNVSVDSDKDNDSTDGDISFSSTIDGGQTLSLDADGGSVTVSGAVGGTTKLTSLTVDAGSVSLDDVATTGGISVNSTTSMTLDGNYYSNDDDIEFTGAVTLGGAVTVDTDADNDGTDGDITFTSTINGGQTLTLDADGGTVDLQGNVGGTTKLTSLTVDGGQVDLKSVKTTGAIDIEGTNIDLNGTAYESDDGNITFTGPVDLAVNVSVDSDKDSDATDGDITFTSTIDGGKTLTLDAGGGAVDLQGNVGGTTKLTSLTVDGGQVDLKSVKTTGAIDVEGTNIDLNGTAYETDGGNIKFTGAVDLTVNVTVDSDKDGTGTDGSITFTSTIDGGQTLTLDADGGSVTVSGAVGGTTKLTSLTVTGGSVSLKGVSTTGAITVTGTGITLNGNYYSNDADIKYTGAVTLAGAVSVDSDADDDATDGDITFTSTVNGGKTLTLDAGGGAVDLQGNVGGTTKLTSLTVDGGQIDLKSVATTGAIDVEGTNIDLNGATYYSDDGDIKFTGPVDLTVNTTVDSDKDSDATDGDITFTSTIDGGQTLTLDAGGGAVDLQGNVGGTAKLTSLTVDGGQVDLKSVKATGAIDVEGTNIDLNGSAYESDDGDIKFTGPVDLTVNVSVDSDKDSDATDGDITFTSTIDGGQTLTLDAGGGAVDLQGNAGGTTKLTSLTVDGGQVDLKSVKTTGAIDIEGTNIDLNGTAYESDDGNITFTGPVDLAANVSVDSDKDSDATDGDITFTSTIDGGRALTLDAGGGAVDLQGNVGGTTKLTSLTVDGGQVDLKSVKTTGAIDVEGTNIDLNGTAYESDDGNIKFTGAVDLTVNVSVDSDKDNDSNDGDITFTSTVNGGKTLTLDAGGGSVDLQGNVGGTTKLTSLTVDGGQVDLSTVATTGAIDIEGTNIDLNGATYYSDGGDITFTGAVDLTVNVSVDSDKDNDSNDGDITFTSTVNGSKTLTLDAGGGAVDLQGNVGGTTKLTSLTVDGGQIDLKSVKATGAVDIEGTNIDLNGTAYESDDGNIKFTGAVDLTVNVSVDSDKDNDSTDGDITFTSTIDGGRALTLDAGGGAVDLQGAVGGTTKLTSLTVDGGQIDLKSVKTTGAIDIEGTNIDLNGTAYETDGGNIKFTGAVDLTANVSVDSDKDGTGTDGSITFTSTIDGGQTLALDADGGSVTVSGAVGGTTKLTSLTVDGGSVSLKGVSTTGAITVTGTGITLNGNYYSNDADIKFTGAVTLGGAVTVDTDADNDGTDGDITFTSTINGGQTLTLDADGGAVDLQGNVGGTTKLTSLTVDGGQTDLKSVKTTGAIDIEGTNIDLNGTAYESDDGNIKFMGPVDLTVNVSVDSDKDNDSTDGDITFTSTIDGGKALTLDAGGGAVDLQGAVGGTTKLTSLTVDGGQVDLNTVSTTGAIDIKGTNIDLNGATYYSDDGDITFTGAVDLHASVTVDSDKDNNSTDGDISFSSTIDGGQTLTLDADGGSVTVSGAVGGTTKLTSLTVTGGSVSLKGVSTTGAITVTGTGITLNGNYYSNDADIKYTGAVTLAGAVSVDSDADDDATDGDITFTSTVNGGKTLTLDAGGGAVDLQGNVGGTTKLTSLTVDGGQIDLKSVATTGAIDVEGTNIDLNGATYYSDDGDIKFTGPVDLTVNTTVDSDKDSDATDGDITFTSTIDGGKALTLDAGGGAVDLQGAVGGTTKLTSLTVDGGQVDLDAVSTTGAIDIEGTNIDLNGATYYSDDGDITFTGAVDLHANVTVDSDKNDDNTDGDISFSSTINGGQTLTLDADGGSVTVGGAMGGTTKLTSLTVNGGSVSLKSVRTSGVITTTGTGITLNGNYYSDDGDITFTGPVTLAGAVSVNSDANNDSTDGDITFTSTVNGGKTLTLDADGGAVDLQGAVGGTTKLTSLTVDGGQVDFKSVATTGAIDVEGTNIDLNGATYYSDDGDITFTGPVDLTVNVSVDSDKDNDGTNGKILFTSTVNGAKALTLDADSGAVELRGAVGGTTKLTSLTVDGGQIDLKSVATTGAIDVEGTNIDLNGATYYSDDGDITFTGPVDLHANVSVDSDKNDDTTDGDITFTSTVNGGRTLMLDADGGAVDLQGAAGGATKLTSLTVDGGQVDLKSVATTGAIDVEGTNIDLNGATYYSNDGDIKFTGAVDLTVNVSVDSDKDNHSTDGDITFTSTIDGGKTLTLDADGGAVDLQGAVGGTTKLTSLTVDGGQVDLDTVATTGAIDIEGTNIDLNGATYYSDDGDITFTGPADLAVNVSVDSDADNDSTDGDITFTSTINGGKSLTLDAGGGAVDLRGAAGGTTKLTSLTVDGGQVDLKSVATTGAIDIEGTNIDLNGATYYSDDGNIKFTGPVDLHANVTVDSDKNDDATDGDITSTSTVNGGKTLTLDADGGAVDLQGAAGGTTKLTSLTVDGGQVDLKSVATTGTIDIEGTNIDLNGATYYSNDGDIKFTGPVDLTVNTTVDSDKDNDATDGDITFTSTIDGGKALTLDAGGGAVDLQGAVGGTTKLTSLTVDGGQVDLDTVATTGAIDIEGTNIDLNGATYYSNDGDITFTGPVDLHANVTVNSDANDDNTDGDISFSSTINGGQTLTLDAAGGSVTVGGAVGGTTKLTSLTVTGSSVSLKSVRTSGVITVTGTGITLNGNYYSDDGDITFTGPVTLAGVVRVNSDQNNDSTDGDITFTSTIDGGKALTLDAGGGSVNLQGAVGGTTKLTSLTVDGGQIDVKSIKTTGAIDIEGTNIDLNSGVYESDDGNITFTGPVDLTVDTTVDSDKDNDGTNGKILFTSTVNGAKALTLDADGGAVELRGAVGGTTKLTSLTVDGGQIDLNTVATTGAIDIEGTNIDLNGATYYSDDGDITFTGPVDLHANVTVDSDANDDSTDGDISFSSTINGGRTLSLDADGGSVTVGGAVGGTTKLTSMTVTGGSVSLKSVRTSGVITVTGTGITLNGNYYSDDGNITFTGPVTLAGAVRVDSDKDNVNTDGNITFTSTIDGGKTLSLDADGGSVDLQGAVGGTTKLTSLTVDGGQIDVKSIKTTGAIDIEGTNIDLNSGVYESDDGNITFTGPVDLTVDTTVDSDKDNDGTNGKILFTSTVNGAKALTLDADGGAVELRGAVGGTTKLTSLTVDGGQIDLNTVATTGAIDIEGTNIDLNGATYYSDDGDITFTGPVDLHANVTVDSDANDDSTDGDISFSSTINGGRTLSLDADGGSVTVGGAVGGTTKLTSMTVTGGSVSLKSVRTSGVITVTGTGITLDGNYYSDDGNITFTGPATLAGTTRVDSDRDNNSTDGDISFSTTINGGNSLTLDAGSGSVSLPSAVGGTTKLASLRVDGGQVDVSTVATTGFINIGGSNVDLNGATYYSDDGNVTFRGPVDLEVDVTIDSDTDDDGKDGSIRFASTLDGEYNLTLDADTGDIYFVGDVGAINKLTTITINKAGNITVAATMNVGSFTQTAGTGETDFGSNTINADDSVYVNTVNIRGKIVAQEATLIAQEAIIAVVEVDSLTVEAEIVDFSGTVDGIGGQGAADQIIVSNRGSGTYWFNGYTILGTGLGTRIHSELSSLPLPTIWTLSRYPVTPASGVYTSYIPILRASVNDAISSAYIPTVFEMPFPLLTPKPGTEGYYEDIPLLFEMYNNELDEME